MTQETKPDSDAEELLDDAEETATGDDAEGQSTPLSAEDQIADLESRWLRAQADYKNLKRRSLSDLEASLQRHMRPLLEELLLVLDFLDMALASPAEAPETKNLVLGVQMTRTKFVQALEASDVEEIKTNGDFDPALHDATETRSDEGAEVGSILSTVRKGFTWQGKVLRPAQVVVAADPDETADDAKD
jgi:molecular chaperone GrpE